MKLKLSVSTPRKLKEGFKLQFHPFRTSAVDGWAWSNSRWGRVTPGWTTEPV